MTISTMKMALKMIKTTMILKMILMQKKGASKMARAKSHHYQCATRLK